MSTNWLTQRIKELLMKIYVVNLERSPQRWEDASKQLKNTGVAFERIPAIDGAKIDYLKYADNKTCRNYMGRDLTAGEVDCFLSHILALKTFLASSEDCAIILEDDFLMTADFSNRLKSIREMIKKLAGETVSAVNLYPSDYKFASTIMQEAGQSLLIAHRFPQSAVGILWTRQGAERVVAAGSIATMPYDNLLRVLFTGTSEGYSVRPPLVVPAPVPSDIKNTNHVFSGNMPTRRPDYFFIRLRRMIKEKTRATIAMLHWKFCHTTKQ